MPAQLDCGGRGRPTPQTFRCVLGICEFPVIDLVANINCMLNAFASGPHMHCSHSPSLSVRVCVTVCVFVYVCVCVVRASCSNDKLLQARPGGRQATLLKYE